MVTIIASFHRLVVLAFLVSNASSISAEEPILSETGVNDVLTNLANQLIQEGGYVHPSLQLVSQSPCGAERGVIFAKELINNDGGTINNPANDHDQPSSIWLRIPFSYQLTRNLALETLTPLIPGQVLKEAPLVTLDDAALLVLLLVHLRGLTEKHDKWHPYLASLPDNPGCGWWGDDNAKTRGYEQMIPNEVIQSSQNYVNRVSHGMAQDYGRYLASEHWPKEWKEDHHSVNDSAALVIKWSLCIISSRGTAASPTHGGGSVRLVPLADMFNHNLHRGGFIELTETDVGSRIELIGDFEVRRQEGAMPGDEITVDYNLAGYSPTDWFLSHGFVPSEVLNENNVGRSEL